MVWILVVSKTFIVCEIKYSNKNIGKCILLISYNYLYFRKMTLKVYTILLLFTFKIGGW